MIQDWSQPWDLQPVVGFDAEAVASGPRNAFAGPVRVELLTTPGRDLLVRVTESFTFFDRDGRAWPVPSGTVADGASIPKWIQWLGGHPLEGDYRRASVVHDPYCGLVSNIAKLLPAAEFEAAKTAIAEVARSRSAEETHRVFYDAMTADNLQPRWKRAAYYRAVCWGGPKW